MKYFAILTGLFFLFYILGFLRKNDNLEFMSRNFTMAIKGFAILTVVWAHAGASLGVGRIQFIAGVGVCLFLICSGYGLEMSWQKNGLKGFWKKRFLNVAIPFWAVELIGLLITGALTMEIYLKDFFFVKAATAYGWFMQYIIICYILFFSLKTIVGKFSVKTQMLITTVVFVSWFVIDSVFCANPDMPFLKARQMLAFLCGMLIAEYKVSFENVLKNKALFVISGGGVIGIVFMGITQIDVVKTMPYLISNIILAKMKTKLALSIWILKKIYSHTKFQKAPKRKI